MQYFALDQEGKLVSADSAQKGASYRCPECDGALRKRLSERKRAHFYHLKTIKRCVHKNKSHTHLAIQEEVFSLLPAGKAFLEHRFLEISRIADVANLSQGLIFEVQCSKITLEEVKKRESDYQSLGLQVVWLLYDKTFNKKRVSAAEEKIREGLSYYANIGKIYDQVEEIRQGKRLYRSAPYDVDLKTPLINDRSKESLPKPLRGRPSLYFRGDLIDLSLQHPKFHEWLGKRSLEEKKVKKYVFFLYQKVLWALYRYTHPSSTDSSLAIGSRRKPQRRG